MSQDKWRVNRLGQARSKSVSLVSAFNRRRFLQYGAIALGTGAIAACGGQQTASSESEAATDGALTPITYGTNWYAQAEHGGFYQAVAAGIYADHGLDVTIQMGGPQVNGTQLLMGGAVDFFMGYGADALKAIAEGIPKVTVAAIFQKDPQILMAHPNQGVETLEDLRGRRIFISAAANVNYWPFLAAKYGFTDDQKGVYNFDPRPFLEDQSSAQQGYLTSEPLSIRKEGGFDPVVLLLADYGYSPYSTTIETKRELVETNPDLVQRFVDASIKGWYSYLEDPAPGNELIKRDNPEMTDDQLDYSFEKLQEYGIIQSGEAETLGIGAMTDGRWQEFFEILADAGVLDPNLDFRQAYTLDFVNKGAEAYTR
jgi:NitT/TauT family transport system substrate-binding protein